MGFYVWKEKITEFEQVRLDEAIYLYGQIFGINKCNIYARQVQAKGWTTQFNKK